jgi:hypothetical protein
MCVFTKLRCIILQNFREAGWKLKSQALTLQMCVMISVLNTALFFDIMREKLADAQSA